HVCLRLLYSFPTRPSSDLFLAHLYAGWLFIARWDIAFGLIVVFSGEKACHLFGQIGPGAQVHQVQALLIDQHGLVGHPLLPGLLGYIVVDILAFGAGVGWLVKTFQFLFVLATENGARHVDSSCWINEGAG